MTAADPARVEGERLAEIYRRIGESRMRALPIYNLALTVAALGFRQEAEGIYGMVLTPWFLNLVHLPADAAGLRQGDIITRRLPAGEVEFIVGVVDGFGPVPACSLFSPMFEFSDQATAQATAEAAMAALWTRPQAPDAAVIGRRQLLFGRVAETP